jgi:hypothetical protein
MARIPIARARRWALDRLVRVLREEYATRLAAEAEAHGLVDLTAPEPEHIFRIAPANAETIIANADAWVSIYPSSPVAPAAQRGSAGPGGYCLDVAMDVTALLVFREPIMEMPAAVARPDGVDPEALESIDLNAELLALLSDVYTGALVHTLLEYGQGGQAIHDIALVADESQVLTNDAGDLFGAASVVVRVTQRATVPNKKPLPSDT